MPLFNVALEDAEFEIGRVSNGLSLITLRNVSRSRSDVVGVRGGRRGGRRFRIEAGGSRDLFTDST